MSLEDLRPASSAGSLGASAARIFAAEIGPRIMLNLEDGGGSAVPSGGDSRGPAAADGSVAAPSVRETPAAREDALDKSLLAVWDKHNPNRTDSGQFAGKEGDTALAGADEAAPASPDAPAKAAPEPAAKPAIEAPNSWSGEMKAKWATLPPEVQTYVAQREGEVHGAITRLGEQVKQFEPVSQVLQRHGDAFSRHGLSHEKGIELLLAANAKLDANPAQALVEIGAQYGFDLRPLLSAQPASGQSPPRPDPVVDQLANRLNQVEGQVTARARAEAESRQASMQAAVAEFAKDKPHFEAVKTVMGTLMTTGHAKSLDEAYDKACHADPAVRAKIQEDQRKADAEKQAAEDKAKAERARRAGGVNVRGGPASASPKSNDAALDEIARKHYG